MALQQKQEENNYIHALFIVIENWPADLNRRNTNFATRSPSWRLMKLSFRYITCYVPDGTRLLRILVLGTSCLLVSSGRYVSFIWQSKLCLSSNWLHIDTNVWQIRADQGYSKGTRLTLSEIRYVPTWSACLEGNSSKTNSSCLCRWTTKCMYARQWALFEYCLAATFQ